MLSVCNALWDTLKNEFFPEPTEDRWREISDAFRKCSHFPNCLGAIDGKHIIVTKSPRSGSMNFNYKCYFSIVLMTIADSDYKFTYADIGAYGKDSDSFVFQETSFLKLLIRNKLHIPPSGSLFTNDTENFTLVFVGDEAFSLSKNLMWPYARHNLKRPCARHNLMRPYAGHNLMRPYAGRNLMRPYAGRNLMWPYAGRNLMRPSAGRNLSEKQRIFNYRLCRARRNVECAFGILSNKCRIIHTALDVSKEFSKDILKACLLLHNLVRSKNGYRSEEIYMRQNWNSVNRAACSRPRRSASDVRDRFADYCMSGSSITVTN